MPSNLDWKQLMEGKAQTGIVINKGTDQEHLVQVIPIRGRKTGRVVRMSVQSRSNGRGTVAR
jgi:hypothetical protein